MKCEILTLELLNWKWGDSTKNKHTTRITKTQDPRNLTKNRKIQTNQRKNKQITTSTTHTNLLHLLNQRNS